MAIIKPFRALRPIPEKAEQVSCVPYDIVDDHEVRDFTRENPLSFLRVTRPEAELNGNSAASAPKAAFERAEKNLQELIATGVFMTEAAPSLYVYRLTAGSHQQTGLVGCCSLDEYERGLIKKHEDTRPDKVKNRTDHLLTLRAQTGLIFLAFRGTAEIHTLFDDAVASKPLYDFFGSDGIRHSMWRVPRPQDWIDAFAAIPSLYIADGHHRVESADAARKILRSADTDHSGDEDYDYVMAGIFPAEDLRILPYNRVVRDLNGLSIEAFLDRLRGAFSVEYTTEKEPGTRGEMCMYVDRKWYKLIFRREPAVDSGPIEQLDVSILQDHILEPLLGIDDARTDNRIGFVGGKRGVAELERMVDSGEASVAFSLFPTTMDDLLAVSDMNAIMPPKSTWFEPKLKDGLLVHVI